MLWPPGHSEKILVPLLFLPKKEEPLESHWMYCICPFVSVMFSPCLHLYTQLQKLGVTLQNSCATGCPGSFCVCRRLAGLADVWVGLSLLQTHM